MQNQEYFASKRREDDREINLKMQKEAPSAAEARKQDVKQLEMELESASCNEVNEIAIADGNRDLGVALEENIW